jgi:general secretion pathway protein K
MSTVSPHACHCVCCAAPRGGSPCLGRPGATSHRQRGAALLMAMLIVTLVASFAGAAAWQQWRAVEVEAAERARLQAGWILVGALDWARLILREDARSGGADHLAEPWAVALQESRLSSFLAADKNNTALTEDEQDSELFLSGQIVDMQSRLNINNLVENNKISDPDLRSFAKLFELLDLDQLELMRMAENLRAALDNSPESRSSSLAPLLPQRVEQLGWLGLSAASLERLRPLITLLPGRTPVNLNTAPTEVLYAVFPTLELDGARRIVAQRERQHFRTPSEAAQVVPTLTTELNASHSIASRFFEVRGRLRLQETMVQERSLVQRTGLEVKAVWRERAILGKFDPQASLQ